MRLFNKRKPKLSVSLLAATILLIFLHFLGWLSPLEQVIVRALSPVQHRIYAVGNSINRLYDRQNTADIESIINERDRLLVTNAQLTVLLSEYQALDQQFNYLQDRGFNPLGARVIGQSFQSDAKILLIDKGWQDGVSVGLPVVVGQGVIVAKVYEVDKYSSKILLINDSQSSLAARIQNDAGVQGVVLGERGLSLRMERIFEEQSIELNQSVVTSGLEPNIPAGLFIGTVDRVEREENSFFQTAFIKPLVDFNDITVVSILIPAPHD